jgi:hypothetical protein
VGKVELKSKKNKGGSEMSHLLLSHPIPKPFTKNGKEDVFDETRVFIDLNYPY